MPQMGSAAEVYLRATEQLESARAPPDDSRTNKAKIISGFGCFMSVVQDVGRKLHDVWWAILLPWVI